MPLVTSLAGSKLQEYGLPNVMMGVMQVRLRTHTPNPPFVPQPHRPTPPPRLPARPSQIQMVAGQDPVVGEGVQLLTACTMGNIDDAAIEAYLAKLG